MALIDTTNFSWRSLIIAVVTALAGFLAGNTITASITPSDGGAIIEVKANSLELSEEKQPAIIEGDKGELTEDENIPTVEGVDGGQFEDEDTGISVLDGDYVDLGWSEWYPTETPETFKNATLGRCIIANNRYGAQCVSLARAFWWSYANRDVSTCGTGMAKGMMSCADANAGDDFVVFGKEDASKIQAGDWLVFGYGQYGHIGMALGPVANGYVTLLGENQGGKSCGEGVGGSAANIINISIKSLIGFYRPKAYIKVEPVVEPTRNPNANTITYTYVKDDYFSKVLKKLGYDEGKLWGLDGTVHFYTKQLIDQDMLDKNGNVKIGIPFTLTKREG